MMHSLQHFRGTSYWLAYNFLITYCKIKIYVTNYIRTWVQSMNQKELVVDFHVTIPELARRIAEHHEKF
jgi:hypothetical protein